MNRLLLFDEGPLSLVTNPRESEQSRRCKQWLASVLARGVRVMVPAIADYELRRELLRANRLKGIDRLDELIERLGIWKSTETCSGMPPRSGLGRGLRGFPRRMIRRSTAMFSWRRRQK